MDNSFPYIEIYLFPLEQRINKNALLFKIPVIVLLIRCVCNNFIIPI